MDTQRIAETLSALRDTIQSVFGNDGTPIKKDLLAPNDRIWKELEALDATFRHITGGGGSGTLNHAALNNRDMAGQHPTEAIIGLVAALAAKLAKNLGAANAGKWLAVDSTGEVVLVQAPNTSEYAGPYAAVGDLPPEGDTNDLYLVGITAPYEIWAWIGGEYKQIGSTSIDLSDYYTKEEVDALLDIARPDLWPMDTEIDFGGGMYGYRKYGYFGDVAAGTNKTVNLGTGKRIMDYGGCWITGTGGFTETIGCRSVDSRENLSHAVSDIVHNGDINTLAVILFTSRSPLERLADLHNYDVWVTYTK
jgi:hypothetical protein